MDVKLPNGQVVKNIPEGTTQRQLAEKLKANGVDVPPEWLPTQASTEAPKEDTSFMGEAQAVGDRMRSSPWGAAKESWRQLNDTRQALLKAITGIPANVTGDVAGLGTMSVGVAANIAQKMGLIDQKTVDKIDPSTVREKVADALTYHPDHPNSPQNQILEAPGRAIAGAGDWLSEKTGADKIPYLDSAVRTIPRAIAELAGVKAGIAARAPLAAGEAAVAEAAPQAAARSTVAPEGAAVPATPVSAASRLPAPAAPLEGEVIPAAPPGAAPKGLPGPQEIPQAPPRAPLEVPPKAVPKTPGTPLAKDKNATPEELHDNAAKTLLSNDIRLTKEQRGIGFANKLAGSAARGADALIGKTKLAREQLQDFTRAVFKKVGIDAKNATPESMQELKQKVTRDYEAAHNGLNIKMDGDLIVDLKEIQARARRNADVERKFDDMFDHIARSSKRTGNDVHLAASDAESIRSELGTMEGSQSGAIKKFASEIKDALDAATERSATPEQSVALRTARKQYHFMRQIEDALDTKNGVVSPRKLLNVIERKRNKNEAFYGAGDQSLVNLARAGAKILPEALGDSGTAARVADWAKFTAPVAMAKAIAPAFGGRLFNEAGARAGTPSAAAEAAAKAQKGTSPLNAAARQAITTKTKEEERRRLQAEALRR